MKQLIVDESSVGEKVVNTTWGWQLMFEKF